MKQFLQESEYDPEKAANLAKVRHLRMKLAAWLLGGVVVVSLVGYFLLWPAIIKWKQDSSLRAASRYENDGDYRRALLTLEQAVQIYPNLLEARRRLANFYERLGQRQALESWREVLRIEPANPRNLHGLAGAALRFGDLDTVRVTLEELKRTGQTGPDYFRLATGLALVTRDNPALENSLAELSRLQPDDLPVQLNLAIARLQHADGARVEAGRAALLQLAQTEQVRIRAMVELFNDIARRWPKPTRERIAAFQHLAQKLTPAQGPRLGPPEENDPVERLLAFAMRQSSPEAADAVVLLNWMILNGRAAAAFEWIDSLPAKTRDSPMLIAASSEAALQSGDWVRLRKLLLAGAWGAVPPGAVDRAIALRENRGRETPAVEHSRWELAIEACHLSLPGLRILLRLSEAWNWPEERQQVLQAVTRAFPAENWAWQQLLAEALTQGDSAELWQIYLRWGRALPGDSTVLLETAIMGLLLQKQGAPAASATAAMVRQQPGHPAASVAHALALWRGKQPAEALAVLAALPPASFTEPRYALVYGLLLAEAGRTRESETMLQRTAAERLLPEELAMVAHARARNRRPAP